MKRTYSGKPPKTIVPPGGTDTQMHMYLPGYPSSPNAVPLPPEAPGAAEYREVMDWLGLSRVIITQGNAHGRDNANVLAGLAEMGQRARGVGIIDAGTTDGEMKRLSDRGIVGARIMDLPGGAVGLGELEDVDARAAAFGWFLAVQFDGNRLLEQEARLAAIRSRWVLDHHGKFFGGIRPDGKEVDAIKRLIDGGRCWFKFAACYESSTAGPSRYEDVAAVARVIGAYAPERIVWGTNWPHNSASGPNDVYPNDADLLDLAMSWLPDDAARHRTLVTNAAELASWTLAN